MESKNIYSEIKIVTLDNFKVAGYHAISNSPENDAEAYIDNWFEKSLLLDYNGYVPSKIGWDVPVSQEAKEKGLRGYISGYIVPEDFTSTDDNVKLYFFQKDNYVTLTITDPFSDPFKTIPKAYNMLLSFAMNNGKTILTHRGVFEKPYKVDGITYMDIYVPVDYL
jgi:effector-binding domain-containing protein